LQVGVVVVTGSFYYFFHFRSELGPGWGALPATLVGKGLKVEQWPLAEM
jgi:hypothetical protein